MDNDIDYRHLTGEAQLRSAFAVMRELRPHLINEAAFVRQIERQHGQGYHLLAACRAGQPVALAGYRVTENLLYGKFVYVDDLVVTAAQQRHGLGGRLLHEVRARALAAGCEHVVLDTGLHMAHAQRFYFRQGLLARGMHFVEPLGEAA